jgi:hypothetical protein
MKLTNFISFGAVLAMAVTPIAAAQAQGVIASSDYMVVRDGKVVSAPSGTLTAGDRVVTRGTSGATLALSGCSLDVPAASSVTIQPNACDSNVQSLQVSKAGYAMGDGSALHGSAWLIALLALAAVIAGAVIAAGGSSKPTSP